MAALLSPKARLLSNFFYDTGLEKILHIICSLKIASTSNAICWQGTLAPRNPVGKGGKGSFGCEIGVENSTCANIDVKKDVSLVIDQGSKSAKQPQILPVQAFIGFIF